MTISEMMKAVNNGIDSMISFLTEGKIDEYNRQKEDTDKIVNDYNSILLEKEYKSFASLKNFLLYPYVRKLSYTITKKTDIVSGVISYEKKVSYKNEIGNILSYYTYSGKNIKGLQAFTENAFQWAIDEKTAIENRQKDIVLVTVSGLRKAVNVFKTENELENEKEIAINEDIALSVYNFFHETSKTINHLKNNPSNGKTVEKLFSLLTVKFAQRTQGKALSFEKETMKTCFKVESISK